MAKCKGLCSKEETDAQNVIVTKVTTITPGCDDITIDDAKNAVNNPVIREQKGTVNTGDGKCNAPGCHCVWDAPPPWPPNWQATAFEWDLEFENDVICKYKVEGTVDIKVRKITGTCYPRLIKGKTVLPKH